MLRSFIREARAKLWSGRPGAPSFLGACRKLLERYTQRQADQAARRENEDGHAEDSSDSEDDDLDEEIQDHEQQPDPQPINVQPEVFIRECDKQRKRYRKEGRSYSIYESHPGNSQVMYVRRGDAAVERSLQVPGRISRICERSGVCKFVVQAYTALEETVEDPFSVYPDFPARLYNCELSETIELVDPRDIKGHFARYSWPGSDSLIAVVPLSQVSNTGPAFSLLYDRLIKMAL